MLTKKVSLGAVWLVGSRMSSNFIGLLGMLVTARLLAPADFGLFAIASSIAVIVSAALELPVSLAIIQMKDPKREDFNTAYTLSVLRGALASLLIVAASWPVAHAFGNKALTPLMFALALEPLILGFRNSYFDVYAKNINFAQESMMLITAKLVYFAAVVSFAVIYQSYWALPVGVIAGALTSLAFAFILPKQRPGFSLKSFHKMWNFSIWLGFGSIVNQINMKSDQLIVGGFFGQSTLGQYAVGVQIASQLTSVVVQPVTRSLFTGFSQIAHDVDRLRKAYISAQGLMLSMIAPAAVGLALVAEPLVLLLLGEKWRPAILFIQFAAPNLAILTVAGPIWAVGMALGHTRTLFIRDSIALGIRLPGQLIGLFAGGLIGFLIVRLATSVLVTAINLAVVRRFISLSVSTQLLSNARIFVSVLVMAAAVALVRGALDFQQMSMLQLAASLAGLAAVGAAVYGASLLSIWKLIGSPNGPETRILAFMSRLIRAAGLDLSVAR